MSLPHAPAVLALAEGYNPLFYDPSAVLLTLIAFFGLFLILWKFAWGPILTGVESREQRIDSAIKSAENDRDEARRTLESYNERVANVEAEIAALREKGRTEAEAVRRELLARAEAEAAALAAAARRDIEQARAQALQDLRREAVDLGLKIATRVVGRSLDGDDQRRLADEVIGQVAGVGGNGRSR